MLTQVEQRKAAKEFAEKWKGIGYEKGDSARFWISLLNDVYGVENPTDFIRFEERVKLDYTSFIDGYIPSTHVLIEQKSIDKNLRKAIRQSDGSLLTPFQQAKRYSAELPYSERPRWIVLSNFKEFHIYDMENPTGQAEVLYLKNLKEDYYRLSFLVHQDNKNIEKMKEISIKAGELVGTLYDALLKEYQKPEDEETLKDLNTLSVRLVFCFYAEDSGLFGRHRMFHDYLNKHRGTYFRGELIKLFRVLNQKPEERDAYIEDDLAAFPYVNGGLFEKKDVEIPRLNDEIIDIILDQASSNFDWSDISPTIFGAVFESTLNPETRRSGGMHYTSIENIHKVIDPLFMNELNKEYETIQLLKTHNIRKRRLEEFQNKLASLKFLDPAAGSGNFLTETYLSLRKLENEVIKNIYGMQVVFGDVVNPIKVSINQFYGIEINDFAVTVANTALWIAESQMIKETEDIIHTTIDFLPIENEAKIIEANALKINWEDIVSKNELDYIMGNPPFIGAKYKNKEQSKEVLKINDKLKRLDYVAAWFKKANDYTMRTKIICAFVATNSITHGEQVGPLWEIMTSEIVFAHKTFNWDSEANIKANVHCVIIGFSHQYKKDYKKILFDSDGRPDFVRNINGYLINAPNINITRRTNPISKSIQKMTKGSQPTDGGNLILTENEKAKLIKKYPHLKPYIKRYMGAVDLINNNYRYCLWLKAVDPNEFRNVPEIKDRLKKVQGSRLNSSKKATQLWADRPYLFTEDRQPDSSYLLLPVVSSENRKYLPIGYVDRNVIANSNAQMIPNADLYTFGILNSNIHNAWMRAIAGRLELRYSYSVTIVYNNFPWPDITEKMRDNIEETAQFILDARKLYPNSSLADLYDELTMPPELRKAHQENDKIVMKAYGFDWRTMNESESVAELMQLYKELIDAQRK